MFSILILSGILALLDNAQSCKFLDLHSEKLGYKRFTPLPTTISEAAGIVSGRTAFSDLAKDKPFYIYHTLSEPVSDGIGRWVINDELGSNANAVAYIDSWAILPHLISDVNDNKGADWMISEGGNWVRDEELSLVCIYEEGGLPTDSTIYFESPDIAIALSGFYLETVPDPNKVSYSGLLYSQVKAFPSDVQLYLYKFEDKWIIGELENIGTDSGVAFCIDGAKTASEITSTEWNVVDDKQWTSDYGFIVAATPELTIYEALREHRSIKYIPKGQRVAYLRNNLVMPLVGLGTGAISSESMKTTIDKALQLGYRSLDLAREYQNEGTVYEILHQYRNEPNAEELPYRSDVFLISKVWPTFLGYEPTSNEIIRSLEALRTTYIDLYYLHWPACNPQISWMHCETTEYPEGNWIESWHALERAYAEGRVNSIGVSNFDLDLLRQVDEIATIRPHAVQNFARIGSLDMEVRKWCVINNAVYQPYASQRVMTEIPKEYQERIESIAKTHGISAQVLSIKFFLQTGAAVIPRSMNESHLLENLNAFEWDLSDQEMKALGWEGTGPEEGDL